MRTTVALSTLIVGLVASTCSDAADKSPGSHAPRIEALRICRAVMDAAARVTCYDRATDELLAAAESRQIVVLDQSEIRTARRGLFGFALPHIPFLDNSGSKKEAEEAKHLVTKVASVASAGYGKVRFRLEDGALWETTESSAEVSDLRAGDTITLDRGMLGAYFLDLRNSRVQARRLPQAER